ncbi:hypothetical protein FOL47_008083 [Perkinsus chesapeaki]|uniref:Uncharacterized protein n=1 Tax=Perkinsus chesapeaki TaxID=330153 RepID=A0A7J6MUQ9_PERCH|nr:hypothetical protein FOL47_008083 [Perkinsus chesapeaki]
MRIILFAVVLPALVSSLNLQGARKKKDAKKKDAGRSSDFAGRLGEMQARQDSSNAAFDARRGKRRSRGEMGDSTGGRRGGSDGGAELLTNMLSQMTTNSRKTTRKK